jgi:phosphopantothenoylcysteine decarboxylase / phosphopantothenate---cysteine ligase
MNRPPRILLGVSGGIAAYKSAEVVRRLVQRGAAVRVAMTRGAREFVAPMTFAVLSGHEVYTEVWGTGNTPTVDHVALSDWSDLLLVAPATAHTIAKFAHGFADDFLSTYFLVHRGPVLLAPAMETAMFAHASVRENLERLISRGVRTVGPDVGFLASGREGLGRMSEPEAIVDEAWRLATGQHRDLAGVRVLVTAGPTREPIDPIRFVSNRSSGKMGYALAEAAASRGARVILVSGPVHLPVPRGVEVLPVRTALEMRDQVMAHLGEAGIVIKAAAVADYHVSKVPDQKVKKTAARISLELDPTPDILAELGRKKGDFLLIGFAAETQNLQQESRRKLESKNCDMVVGNLVGGSETGFESDENEVVLVLRTGETIPLPRATKRAIADRIFDEVLKLRLALYAANGR